MTKTTPQAVAIVLSALMTLAVVAGMNGIAAQQYAKADTLVAMQTVTGAAHRANV